ncbi:MAG: hypothetical protein ABSA11_00215 [Candidatus Bathyarchaeia archaeon]
MKESQDIVEKFRLKGATSSERAMTIEELGLPPVFKDMMSRRLGQSGIVVEVSGKYYLSEVRLKEVRDSFPKRRNNDL